MQQFCRINRIENQSRGSTVGKILLQAKKKMSSLSKFLSVKSRMFLFVLYPLALLYQTSFKGAKHTGLKNNTAAFCNGVFCLGCVLLFM